MLVILTPDTDEASEEYEQTWKHLRGLEDIRLKKHKVLIINMYLSYRNLRK